jgi:hypothetical protein
VTVGAIDSGWYAGNGEHTASNNNYLVGECDSCGRGGDYNNYFTFNLANVSGTITGATLSAFNPTFVNGLLSTWSVWDVSTPIALIDVNRSAGDATGLSIFNDFQSGILFGSLNVSGVANDSLVSVELNSNALAALNAGRGGQFAIGGTLRQGQNVIPGAVPEPSTWAMMLIGFGAIGFSMRRRRQAVYLLQAS